MTNEPDEKQKTPDGIGYVSSSCGAVEPFDTLLETEAFVVFLDKNQRPHWRASFPLSKLPEDCQNVISAARILSAIPASYLDSTNFRAWNCIIAESIILALSKLDVRAKAALNLAQKFVINRARETARLWIVQASVATVIVAFLIALLDFAIVHHPENFWLASTLPTRGDVIWQAMFFSAIGAQFSVLIRLNKMAIDPAAGKWAHYTEASIRILMGVLAGVIISVAIKAQVTFGFVNGSGDAGKWLVCIFCTLAGASERFVPSFLQQMEYRALTENNMPVEPERELADESALGSSRQEDSQASRPHSPQGSG